MSCSTGRIGSAVPVTCNMHLLLHAVLLLRPPFVAGRAITIRDGIDGTLERRWAALLRISSAIHISLFSKILVPRGVQYADHVDSLFPRGGRSCLRESSLRVGSRIHWRSQCQAWCLVASTVVRSAPDTTPHRPAGPEIRSDSLRPAPGDLQRSPLRLPTPGNPTRRVMRQEM